MLKEFIKKMIYKEKYNSETYISWLQQQGMKIGERVNIFVPSKTTIDITCP